MNSIYQTKRDNLGTIPLDKLKLNNLNYTREGKYDNFSFTFKNKKYFFKKCSSINNIYNELLAEELAKDYGIKCANYDLASYNGMIGTISQNFLIRDDFFYHLSEIIEDGHNNIQDILHHFQEKYNTNIVNTLKKEIIDILIFDILIANHDRHSDNLGIIENKNGVHFSPIFDNEQMLDYRSIYNDEYSLNIDKNGNKEKLTYQILFNADEEYKDKLISKLGIITFENIAVCLKRVEEKINSKINPYIKNNIYESFYNNYKFINNDINKEKVLIRK